MNVLLSACDRPPCMYSATAGHSATGLSPCCSLQQARGVGGHALFLLQMGVVPPTALIPGQHFGGRFYHLQVEVVLRQASSGSR